MRSFAAALLAALALSAAPAALAGRFCSPSQPPFCVTGSTVGTDADFQIIAPPGVRNGWVAVGIGESMPGSEIFAFWFPDPANAPTRIVASKRYGTAFVMPRPAASGDQTAVVQPDSGILPNGTIYIHFRRPFAASTASASSKTLVAGPQSFIWAYSDSDRPSPINDPQASFSKHVFSEPMGAVTLFETAPNAAPPPPGTPAAPVIPADTLDPRNAYIRAHGILMALAWGVFAPIGVATAVFAKGQKWFPVHFYVMGALTALCTVVGFALAVYYISASGIKSFTNYHEIIGLVVFICTIIQVSLGVYIHHLYDPNRTKRPIRNHAHIWFGRAVSILGVANVALGIQQYGSGSPLAPGASGMLTLLAAVWYGMESTTNPYLWAYIGWIVAWTLLTMLGAFLVRRSVAKKSGGLVKGESEAALGTK
ncbi:hypothetical protein DFJ74DRAFT_647616 [Hyaloraphidium curvatum]|nr:hypothetical protein DFJ74DRAFT_647616 [Hyaloraphidium curvatum]